MGGVAKKSRTAVARNGLDAHGTPTEGWIRTMRHARDLSLRELGHVAERRELEGGISLYQLRRFAQALECDLFYAFVPRPRRAEAAAAGTVAEEAEPRPVPPARAS
jgi:hypothetical protein